jgi:hypothetical protein
LIITIGKPIFDYYRVLLRAFCFSVHESNNFEFLNVKINYKKMRSSQKKRYFRLCGVYLFLRRRKSVVCQNLFAFKVLYFCQIAKTPIIKRANCTQNGSCHAAFKILFQIRIIATRLFYLCKKGRAGKIY